MRPKKEFEDTWSIDGRYEPIFIKFGGKPTISSGRRNQRKLNNINAIPRRCSLRLWLVTFLIIASMGFWLFCLHRWLFIDHEYVSPLVFCWSGWNEQQRKTSEDLQRTIRESQLVALSLAITLTCGFGHIGYTSRSWKGPQLDKYIFRLSWALNSLYFGYF